MLIYDRTDLIYNFALLDFVVFDQCIFVKKQKVEEMAIFRPPPHKTEPN